MAFVQRDAASLARTGKTAVARIRLLPIDGLHYECDVFYSAGGFCGRLPARVIGGSARVSLADSGKFTLCTERKPRSPRPPQTPRLEFAESIETNMLVSALEWSDQPGNFHGAAAPPSRGKPRDAAAHGKERIPARWHPLPNERASDRSVENAPYSRRASTITPALVHVQYTRPLGATAMSVGSGSPLSTRLLVFLARS